MNEFHVLRAKVGAVSGDFWPPYGYWLPSEPSFSYCRSCARKARWKEMGNVGPPPFEITRFYYRDPIEDNIRDGIDGGFDAGVHDNTQACETCRITLAYWLTDEGILDEIAFYEENPDSWCADLREEAYALDRLFEVHDPELINAVSAIAERFLKHVEQEQL